MSSARRTTAWWRDNAAAAVKHLTALLNDAQLSAPQLAEKADIDVRTVYRILNGSVKTPHADTLKTLFAALGTDTQRFRAALALAPAGSGATSSSTSTAAVKEADESVHASSHRSAPHADMLRSALDRYDATHGTSLAESITNAVLSLPEAFYESADASRRTEESLSQHALEVAAWSERSEFVGLKPQNDTPTTTVYLYVSVPRKFGHSASSERVIAEELLLDNSDRYALLGDLGSGKTTTVKRLARYLLQYPSQCPLFPLVIRFRELSRARLLEEVLADIFGIPHSRVPVALDGRETSPLLSASISSFTIVEIESVESAFVIQSAGEPIEHVLARALRTAQVVLLIDGLDETATEIRSHTENTIVKIIRAAPQIRITLTCRPSEYTVPLEGISPVQLSPLDPGQIATIVRHLCSNPKDFTRRLGRTTYADMASRPLFLCQLIQLYEADHHLPRNPPAVYRRIVRLALHDWDQQKKFTRPSRYALFGTEAKVQFLTHLAFHLTFSLREKQFDTDTLTHVYRSICAPFRLPASEALLVAGELETHTGLFQEAGGGKYEFAFLSMQEYLAAERLVELHLAPNSVADFLKVSPATVAVAIALSDSDHQLQYLYAILKNKAVLRSADTINWSSFFHRVALESPEFTTKHVIARVVGEMLWSRSSIDGYLRRLLIVPEVQAAFDRLFDLYRVTIYESGEHRRYELQVQTFAPDLPERTYLQGPWVAEVFPRLAFAERRHGKTRQRLDFTTGGPV